MTKKSVIDTARRLLYLRRCAVNDIPHYETQLEQMSREYNLIIDLDNDEVGLGCKSTQRAREPYDSMVW